MRSGRVEELTRKAWLGKGGIGFQHVIVRFQ